jgi:hypothetical protein
MKHALPVYVAKGSPCLQLDVPIEVNWEVGWVLSIGPMQRLITRIEPLADRMQRVHLLPYPEAGDE